jgi:hypothetical protein
MKKMATWISKAVVAGLALALTLSVVAQTQEATATVTRIKGSARYSTDAANWKPLKVGMQLGGGVTIQTGAGSYVDLLLGEPDIIAQTPKIGEYLAYKPLAEQDSLRIYEDSVLALDKLTTTKTGMDEVKETQLDLRAGTIFGKVKKLSAASKYEIKLPNGVAGIRGTIYSISAQGVVSVLTGSVVIAYTGSDGTVVTQVVNAGYEFDTRTGQLTPIPDFKEKEMVEAARQAGVGPSTVPTTITVDQTEYYISPTQGSSDGSGALPPPLPPPLG